MVDIRTFDPGNYDCGRPFWFRTVWFLIGNPALRATWLPFSGPRRALLRLFGAKVGKGVLIRPGVRVKNPWLLSVADYAMLGEDVWIDNLAPVDIGAHACLSQAAYLCTGNHDWSSMSFRYRLGAISIGDGAWVGARAVVGPGVTVGKCAVLTLGSIAVKSLGPFEIHAGNPAVFKERRTFQNECSTTGNN